MDKIQSDDNQPKNWESLDFQMNDKCAAGTGVLEIMAKALKHAEDFGKIALTAKNRTDKLIAVFAD